MMNNPIRTTPPDFQKLMKVLRREATPDRVHFIELGIDRTFFIKLIEEATGKTVTPWPDAPQVSWALEAEFYHLAGYDYLRPAVDIGFFNPNRTITQDTHNAEQARAWACEGTGALDSWDAFEKYPWPDPEKVDFGQLEWSLKNLPDGMGIIQMVRGGIFEWATELMGLEGFCMTLFDQPDLVEAVLGKIGQAVVRTVELALQRGGIGAIFLGDDLGYKGATLISPVELRRLVLPWHTKVAQACHDAGVMYFLHSCGNLSELMDDLVNTVKIDAKHSYEDVIQPVEEVSAQWGDQVAILGGLDINILAGGSVEDTRTRTRTILEACIPRGAYALGSGNSLANYVLYENYRAMLEEGVRFLGK